MASSTHARRTYPELGHVLRAARLASGYRLQIDLARTLGTKSQVVGQWENGLRRPNPTQLAALSALLGVNHRELSVMAGYATASPATQTSHHRPLPIERLSGAEFEELVLALAAKCFSEGVTVATAASPDGQASLAPGAFVGSCPRRIVFQMKTSKRFGPIDFAGLQSASIGQADINVLALSRSASLELKASVRNAGWVLWDKETISAAIWNEVAPPGQNELITHFFPGWQSVLRDTLDAPETPTFSNGDAGALARKFPAATPAAPAQTVDCLSANPGEGAIKQRHERSACSEVPSAVIAEQPSRVAARRCEIIVSLSAEVSAMQCRAVERGGNSGALGEELAWLRSNGMLCAPLPMAFGGLGIGTEPDGALALFDTLRLLGAANLHVGHLFANHVSALQLIYRFGSTARKLDAARWATEGHLFGFWNDDAIEYPVFLENNGKLYGDKIVRSGADLVTRALVALRKGSGGGPSLALIATDSQQELTFIPSDLSGMPSPTKARVEFRGLRVANTDIVGSEVDFLQAPSLPRQAWRTLAVKLGGLEALAATLAADPHPETRRNTLRFNKRSKTNRMIVEMARLWVREAATLAEIRHSEPADMREFLENACVAVNAAYLDTVKLVLSVFGPAAHHEGTLTRLLLRDLRPHLGDPAASTLDIDAASEFLDLDRFGPGRG